MSFNSFQCFLFHVRFDVVSLVNLFIRLCFSFMEIDKKVVIVSVFGKSCYHAKGCKTDMLSSILQINLLDEPEVDEDSWVMYIFLWISLRQLGEQYCNYKRSIYQCEIEGYQDVEENIIYLHLRGFFDAHTLLTEYEKFTEKQERKDFLSVWAHMRDKYARALLVLFHISHVIILTHPTHTFDHSYVQLFRAMDIVRLVHQYLL